MSLCLNIAPAQPLFSCRQCSALCPTPHSILEVLRYLVSVRTCHELEETGVNVFLAPRDTHRWCLEYSAPRRSRKSATAALTLLASLRLMGTVASSKFMCEPRSTNDGIVDTREISKDDVDRDVLFTFSIQSIGVHVLQDGVKR